MTITATPEPSEDALRLTPATWKPAEPIALPLCDAGPVVGLGRTRMFDLAKSGELETFMVGGRRLVSLVALRKFVADRDPAMRATA